MIKSKIPQKEIAKFFGCSEPAVSKRIRKLIPKPDLSHLTDKQRAFVIEVCQGNNPTQSAMSVYDCKDRNSAKVLASNMMNNPEITDSIKQIMDYVGLTCSYRIERLKHWVDHPDGDFSLRGLDMSFKLDGSYAPQKFEYQTGIESIASDLVELLEKLQVETEVIDITEIKEKGNDGSD